MSIYIQPILTAFIMFGVLGYLLVIPWLVYSYRKYGYFSFWASIVVYSFIFYMLSALFLVLLPLPTTRNTCAFQSPDTIYYSLKPFTFIEDIFKSGSIIWSQPRSYIQIFNQSAFWQAAFNFLLLLPFGVYLRYFFKEKRYWKRTLALGFALSLFYEVTQITGIYGIYKCPYRLFDVDDLMLNSTGALFGFLVAPVILALFPSKEKLLAKAEKMKKSRLVPPLSQLLAVLIDYIFIKLTFTFTVGLLTSSGLAEMMYTTAGFVALYFVLPLRWGGKTIGTSIMRFKLSNLEGDVPSWQAVLKRTIALYLPWLASMLFNLLTHIKLEIESHFYAIHVWVTTAVFTFVSIMWLTLCIHAVFVILKKGKRTFYFDHVADIVPIKNEENS
ncbi:VanZ family protein [Pseudobacillus badius]|uniref:VanZ family protein n=2 Tax=Bacillus badius TaxID=1455 RepID=UPI0007B085FD|nr:VanZ family protein [Bacillus badius]KZO00864.1 antibiotic resistance protein VanZ [Bacillus badius]MED0665649.1 VanZ family protein [Bacillus badius]OCS88794.1 antibiotic resistance protein VanZ [Bacillus badius]OVE49600.1 VanZ family protein [Bacillus badius]TDW00980.1 glycopeptide antibiotics resistance protein [Bacillus badius]